MHAEDPGSGSICNGRDGIGNSQDVILIYTGFQNDVGDHIFQLLVGFLVIVDLELLMMLIHRMHCQIHNGKVQIFSGDIHPDCIAGLRHAGVADGLSAAS